MIFNKYRKANIKKYSKTDTFVSILFNQNKSFWLLTYNLIELKNTFTEFKSAFGANLRQLRKDKQVSAGDLANNSDLSSETYILSVERGEKDIQLSTIFKLAKGLNIEPKDLLDFKI